MQVGLFCELCVHRERAVIRASPNSLRACQLCRSPRVESEYVRMCVLPCTAHAPAPPATAARAVLRCINLLCWAAKRAWPREQKQSLNARAQSRLSPSLEPLLSATLPQHQPCLRMPQPAALLRAHGPSADNPSEEAHQSAWRLSLEHGASCQGRRVQAR